MSAQPRQAMRGTSALYGARHTLRALEQHWSPEGSDAAEVQELQDALKQLIMQAEALLSAIRLHATAAP